VTQPTPSGRRAFDDKYQTLIDAEAARIAREYGAVCSAPTPCARVGSASHAGAHIVRVSKGHTLTMTHADDGHTAVTAEEAMRPVLRDMRAAVTRCESAAMSFYKEVQKYR